MRKLIDKLTAYLIRRNPRQSLAAAAFFLAHEEIIEAASDAPNATQEQLYEAGEDLAERMLDVATCELDGAYLVLERAVER